MLSNPLRRSALFPYPRSEEIPPVSAVMSST
jgi:hypothetical protein